MTDHWTRTVSMGITTILVVSFIVLDLVWAYVAFTGGTMPIIGVEVDGGVGSGLLWLFVGAPVAMFVARLVAMAIILPLALLGPDEEL